jgi:hypothetical protein
MLDGISKENPDVLGFVIDSLFSGAIGDEDLKEWAIGIIRDNDVEHIPYYIFELADFNGRRADLFELIGFSFDWKCTKSQSKALYGIALKRGEDLGEECTPKAALKALEKHPEIEQRFRETFPFIDF